MRERGRPCVSIVATLHQTMCVVRAVNSSAISANSATSTVCMFLLLVPTSTRGGREAGDHQLAQAREILLNDLLGLVLRRWLGGRQPILQHNRQHCREGIQVR